MLNRISSQHCTRQIPFTNRKALSIHAELANDIRLQDTKLNEQSMFNQLLRPPTKKSQSENKVKKYECKFKKPDIENLIQENNLLKKDQVADKKTIMNQKVRITELEKKVAKLETHETEQAQAILEKNKFNQSAYTQILKKKIHDLQTKCLLADAEIKRLNKLPNASLFEQENIEKQHLLAETIRLKAILVSYEQEDPVLSNTTTMKNIVANLQSSKIDIENVATLLGATTNQTYLSSGSNIKNNWLGSVNAASKSLTGNKFQQQFFRALKEENEKLKATMRLLENDKIFLKSKQNIQKKQFNVLKKELESIKNKVVFKEAEIERLINENKNILFKKAAQFRDENSEKENQEISNLNHKIDELSAEKKKLEEENKRLAEDSTHLKQKMRDKQIQYADLEQNNNRLRNELSELENKLDRMKSLKVSQRVRHGIVPSNYNADLGSSAMVAVSGNLASQDAIADMNINWKKTIKLEQIHLPLLVIWSLKYDRVLKDYDDILKLVTQDESDSGISKSAPQHQPKTCKNKLIKIEEFFAALQKKPISLPENESKKLVKYIYADHSHNKDKHPVIEWSLITTILRASINQLLYSLDSITAINSWRCLLSKCKKFVREIEESTDQFMESSRLIDLASASKSQSLNEEEINLMVVNTFSRQESIKRERIMLDRIKILECFYGLQGNPEFMEKMCTNSETLAHVQEHQKIIKIKINDQDEESLIGDNTSSYLYHNSVEESPQITINHPSRQKKGMRRASREASKPNKYETECKQSSQSSFTLRDDQDLYYSNSRGLIQKAQDLQQNNLEGKNIVTKSRGPSKKGRSSINVCEPDRSLQKKIHDSLKQQQRETPVQAKKHHRHTISPALNNFSFIDQFKKEQLGLFSKIGSLPESIIESRCSDSSSSPANEDPTISYHLEQSSKRSEKEHPSSGVQKLKTNSKETLAVPINETMSKLVEKRKFTLKRAKTNNIQFSFQSMEHKSSHSNYSQKNLTFCLEDEQEQEKSGCEESDPFLLSPDEIRHNRLEEIRTPFKFMETCSDDLLSSEEDEEEEWPL